MKLPVVPFIWLAIAAWGTTEVAITLSGSHSPPLDELAEARRLAPKYEAEVEVRLWDDTRCDLLSAEFAIEVDWAPKWAEAVGQCLYYARLTGRKPNIILLVKNQAAESRFIYRCQTVCAEHDIKLFIERVEQ